MSAGEALTWPPATPDEAGPWRPRTEDKLRERNLRTRRPEGKRWLTWRRQIGRLPPEQARAAFLRLLISCGYRPEPHQVSMHVAGPRKGAAHKLILGGIRSGKSYSCVWEMLLLVLANPGGRFLITAPTYSQLEGAIIPLWRAAVEALERHGYRVSWRGVRPTSLIDHLICGGRVYFRSYSKVDHLLGFEFASIWADELETVTRPREILDTLLGRLSQSIAADGSPIAIRQALVSSTPRGLGGAVSAWDDARMGADVDTLRAWYWCRFTPLQNPHLPDDYVSSLRRSYSKRRWDQEVLALVLQHEARILSEYDDERHGLTYTYDPGLPYDLAYDPGEGTCHVLWIQRHPRWGAVIFHELAEDQLPRHRVQAEVERICAALGKPPTWVVTDRAIKQARAWAQRAFPRSQVTWCITHDEQDVEEGTERVRLLLDPLDGEPRLYVARHLQARPGRRGIHACMHGYRYKVRADGTVTRTPYKDDIHDHGPDALRMWAVRVATRPQSPDAVIPMRMVTGSPSRRSWKDRR